LIGRDLSEEKGEGERGKGRMEGKCGEVGKKRRLFGSGMMDRMKGGEF
jgi:hypothetical protein